MARHRVPGEEPVEVERGGISPVVLILTVAALVVFTVGVVWAAVGKPHETAAPPVTGSGLVEPGRTADLASRAGGGPSPSTTPVVPHAPNVQIGGPSVSPSGEATGRPGTTATTSAPRSPASSHTHQSAAGLTVTASTNSWNGWYFAYYTITNGTSGTVHGWTVTVTFKAPVTDTHAWNVDKSIDGTRVTLRSLSYNSVLKPGESASFGLQATSGGSTTPVPVSCTVNGRPCSG